MYQVLTSYLAGCGFLAILPLFGSGGTLHHTVLQYWHAISKTPTAHPKGLRSAVILLTWEIWKKRNTCVFNNKSQTPSALMQKIKDEGRNWIFAGDKHVGEIVA